MDGTVPLNISVYGHISALYISISLTNIVTKKSHGCHDDSDEVMQEAYVVRTAN